MVESLFSTFSSQSLPRDILLRMLALESLAEKWDALFRRRPDADRFCVRVISSSSETFNPAHVPFELRYAMKIVPDGSAIVRGLLEKGFGIAIQRVPCTSQRVVEAVERISSSQRKTIVAWLERLIFFEEIPIFSQEDIHSSPSDLFVEVRLLLRERFSMIRFTLVDLEGKGMDVKSLECVSALNRAVSPLSAAYFYHRILSDRTSKSIRGISLFLRTVFFIGPITTFFFSFSSILAFLLAARGDALLRESEDIFSLRRSGYTSRQLFRAYSPHIFFFFLDILFVVLVASFFRHEQYVLAGFLFGIVAISFSVVHFFREFLYARSALFFLAKEGRVFDASKHSLSYLAAREHLSDPFQRGVLVGIIFSPLFCMLMFFLAPFAVQSGWFLACLAILHLAIALVFFGFLKVVDRFRFLYSVRGR